MVTGTIIHTTFQPARGFSSAHIQTIWPSLLRTKTHLPLQSERVELADGDFIDIAFTPEPIGSRPAILFLHGLGGSLVSHYAKPLLHALHNQGFTAIFMHLRGASLEPNRLNKSYHAGYTADVVEVIDHLKQQGHQLQGAVGYSLGANLLLKYLAENAGSTPFSQAVAVSVPFDLESCCRYMEKFPALIYGDYLLRKLKHAHRRKFAKRPDPLHIKLRKIRTLYQFDDAITAPFHGYANASDYYQQNSCLAFLPQITTPTLIVHAIDDPLIPAENIPTPAQLSQSTCLELTQKGGHIGFIAERGLGKLSYWLEQRIVAYFNSGT